MTAIRTGELTTLFGPATHALVGNVPEKGVGHFRGHLVERDNRRVALLHEPDEPVEMTVGVLEVFVTGPAPARSGGPFVSHVGKGYGFNAGSGADFMHGLDKFLSPPFLPGLVLQLLERQFGLGPGLLERAVAMLA